MKTRRFSKISTSVFLLVLLGAALHAGWNAVLKIRLEPFLAITLISVASSIMALPMLAYTGLPDRASWGWLAFSIALHLLYYITLSEAYRRADMSVVYPIARGAAPLITASTAVILLGEPLRSTGFLGIAILAAGILLMTWNPKNVAKTDTWGISYAGMTAFVIAGYTLSDGLGARASGNALAYSALLFVLSGIPPVLLVLVQRGRDGLAPLRGFVWPGLAGGFMSMAAYTIAIWAMSVAPIPLVAAVRETSVLFGAAIALIFLKEPFRWSRLAAAISIVFGLILMRI